MKILKITTFYPVYIKKFYSKHPQLSSQSYEQQKKELDYDAFGWGDFWSQALNPLGYEAMEITANIEPLQKSWAIENSIQFEESNWLQKITIEQIKYFKPDILFLADYSVFSSFCLEELKQICPSIRLIVSWCGSPYHDEAIFKSHDLVLSCIPELVEQFREMGQRSEHLNHAFEPRLLNRIDLSTQSTIDFSFVGQIVRGSLNHDNREQILEQLISQVPIQIYSPSADITWKDNFKISVENIIYSIFQSLKKLGISIETLSKLPKIGYLALLSNAPLHPVNPHLQPFMKSPVFGLEMFQTLHNSKITFNNHINISPHSASNMRLFEATGVGTCLITDWKANIKSLFEPDREVITYHSAEECVKKVKWLLENPQETAKIAQAGQARTLKDHTFAQRGTQLDEIIRNQLKN